MPSATTAPFDGGLIHKPLTFVGVAVAPPLSPVNDGTLYYDNVTQHLYLSENGGAYQQVLTSGSSTLQAAYNSGQSIVEAPVAGAITQTQVSIVNSVASGADVLTLAKTPAAAQAGNVLTVSNNANATGNGLDVTTLGTGVGLNVVSSGVLGGYFDSTLAAGGVVVGNSPTRAGAGPGPSYAQFTVNQEGGDAAISATFGAGASSPFFAGIQAGGTLAAPTQTANGAVLMGLVGFGYDTADTFGPGPAVAIEGLVDGAVGPGSIPTTMLFLTTPVGGGITLRAAILSTGTVIVGGTTTPTSDELFSVQGGGTFLDGSLRQPPLGGDPALIVGQGQVYTKVVTGEQQLFYESDLGTVNQITPVTSGGSLQSAYNGGNTIATAAGFPIAFSNAVDASDLLTLTRTFAGAGLALSVSMGAATTGNGVSVATVAGSTGAAYSANVLGTSATSLAIDVLTANGTVASFASSAPEARIYVGNGTSSATPMPGLLSGTDGLGAGIPGATMSVAGGVAGDAATAGGMTRLQVACAGTGTTLTDAVVVNGDTFAPQVGIGFSTTSTPLNKIFTDFGLPVRFAVVADGGPAFFGSYASAGAPAVFFGAAGNGTVAAPTPSVNGDALFTLAASGIGSDSLLDTSNGAAQIAFTVDGAAQAAYVPGRMDFKTKLDGGAPGAPTTRMTIRNNGFVGVGQTSATGTETFAVTGDTYLTGKLTVTGVIDPTAVLLSVGTNLYFQSADGSTAAVAPVNQGRLRYVDGTGWQVSSSGGAYATLSTGGSPPFSDASALVKNSVDPTKLLIFSAVRITTATTRTLTAPDIDGIIVAGTTDTGLRRASAGRWLSDDDGNGGNYMTFGNGGSTLQAAGTYGWSPTSNAVTASDTWLQRDALGTVGVYNTPGGAGNRGDLNINSVRVYDVLGAELTRLGNGSGALQFTASNGPSWYSGASIGAGAIDTGLARNAAGVTAFTTGSGTTANGDWAATNGTLASAGKLSWSTDTAWARVSAGLLKLTNSGATNYVEIGNGIGVNLQATGLYGWSSTADATAAADTWIARDALGTFGFYNTPGGVANRGDLNVNSIRAYDTAGAEKSRLGGGTGFLEFGNVVGLSWSSSTNVSGTRDTGINRNAAGVVAFTTGAGTSGNGSWTATNGTLAGLFTNTGGVNTLSFTSTTALTVNQTGGGGNALTVDTTNTRVGVGGAPGAFTLDVTGTLRVTGASTLASATLSTPLAAPSGGTGTSTTTTGDLLVGAAANTWSKLAIGASGFVLTSNGTTATWAASAASTLASVLAAGNTTGANNIIVSASQNIQWASGGTYSGSAPELLGPVDTNFFIAARVPAAGAGNGISVQGAAGATGNNNGGTGEVLGGAATGTGNGGVFMGTGGAGGPTSGSGGAATVLGGAAQNGTGGAGTFGSGNSAGTDRDGATSRYTGGLGTGAGVPGHAVISTGFPLATGTTLQTQGDRVFVSAKTLVLSNTNNTTTTFATLSLASNTTVGCTVFFTVEISDGSSWAAVVGTYSAIAANNAGTTTVGSTIMDTGEKKGVNVAPFTGVNADAAVTTSGTSLALQVTVNWILGTPTLVRITYTIIANGQATTITPI